MLRNSGRAVCLRTAGVLIGRWTVVRALEPLTILNELLRRTKSTPRVSQRVAIVIVLGDVKTAPHFDRALAVRDTRPARPAAAVICSATPSSCATSRRQPTARIRSSARIMRRSELGFEQAIQRPFVFGETLGRQALEQRTRQPDLVEHDRLTAKAQQSPQIDDRDRRCFNRSWRAMSAGARTRRHSRKRLCGGVGSPSSGTTRRKRNCARGS